MRVLNVVRKESRSHRRPEISIEGMSPVKGEGHPFKDWHQRTMGDRYLRQRRARFGFFWQH